MPAWTPGLMSTAVNKPMHFPLELQLVTARCRLRAPTRAELPHVFSATRYPGFNDGMPWDPPASEAELEEFFQQSVAAWETGDTFTFSIETLADATFLGRIAIRRTPDPRVWNLGFWLHPSQQRKGFMTEAALAVVEFGFEQLGAVAIEACYATWNVRSRRVLERLGMVEVAYLRRGFQKRGVWVPEYRMRVEREAPPPPNVVIRSGA